ncbi:MAG: anti-sigma factor domain-containing protein [Bacteroidia bacterium]
MDIKAYIESGILEQFVLGNTSAEETMEVVQLAASHPEIQAEIEAIEDALFKYAQSHDIAPPTHIKDQLFSKLDLDEATATGESVVSSNSIPFTIHKVETKKAPTFNYFMMAASFALLCMSVAGNIYLYNKWQNTESEVVALNAEKQSLTTNLKAQEAGYSALENKLEVIQNPDIKPVVIKGLALMPNGLATIYWNPKNSEVYINANTLPQTPEAEQYQLWAIVDGKPVDAGVFETKEALKGMVKMKNIAGASAFAVTIEKKGGSLTPTLEKMVLMGGV